MTDPVDDFYNLYHSRALEVVQQLQNEVTRLGFEPNSIKLKQPDEAIYRLEKDPYNQQDYLAADWRDDNGIKIGALQFNSDGQFFIEQDIVQAHPKDKRWFVEAVQAWGNESSINSEARLIENPE